MQDKIPGVKDELKAIVDRLAPFDLEDVKDLLEEGKDLVEAKALVDVKDEIARLAQQLAGAAKESVGDAVDAAKAAVDAAKARAEELKQRLAAVVEQIKKAIFNGVDEIPALLNRFKDSQLAQAVEAAAAKAKGFAQQQKAALEAGQTAAADQLKGLFEAAKGEFEDARAAFLNMLEQAGELSIDDIADKLQQFSDFDISKRLGAIKADLADLVEQAKNAAGDAKDKIQMEIRKAQDALASKKWSFQRIADTLTLPDVSDETKALIAKFKDSKPAQDVLELMENVFAKVTEVMQKLKAAGSDADPAVAEALDEIDAGRIAYSGLVQQLVLMDEASTTAAPTDSIAAPSDTTAAPTDTTAAPTDSTASDEGVMCTDERLPTGGKCSCKVISGCSSCLKKGDDVTCQACEPGRFSIDGKCPARVECKGGKTAAGNECKCQSGTCHRCTVTTLGEPSECAICKRFTFNHEGACLATCPVGTAHINRGSSQYGGTCQPAFTCFKGKIVTVGHPREGKACRCESKNCIHCSFGISTEGVDTKCLACTNKLYFHEGECKTACPADLTHSGLRARGRQCIEAFDCDAVMQAAGKCQCDKRCAECSWEAGNVAKAHVCTKCKRAKKAPRNGAC